MYCKVCGNKLNEGEHFCARCGARVSNNQQNSNVLNNGFNNMDQNQSFSSNTNLSEQKIENNINNNMQSYNRNTTKKKRKWWRIPIIVFFTAVGITILKAILGLTINLIGDKESEIYPLLKLFAGVLLPAIQLICALGFFPSIIFAIVMSAKHPTDDYEEKLNNVISSNLSLDEKLLITFIGINYDKITTKKFSVSAMFLSWAYMLYRKMYIPAIIGMIVVSILGLIPDSIYTIIILFVCVVLGLNFNKWYVAYSKKQIDKIKTSNPNANEMELINICKKKGGTNIGVAILIYIIFIISGFIISGFIFPQTREDVDAGIWGLNFSMPSNFIKQDEKVAYFTYEVEYDASTLLQYCTFKLSAQNNASAIKATNGLHSPDSYLYKDYSPIEAKSINSNTWYYQTKKNNTYYSYFYSTKYNDIHYLIEFKIDNDNTQCHEDYMKIISSLKFK